MRTLRKLAVERAGDVGALVIDAGVRDHPSVLHFRGTIASERGRFAEAETLLRRALASSPNPVPSWSALAMIKTCAPDDPDLAAMEALSRQSSAHSGSYP